MLPLNGFVARPDEYHAANAFEWLRGCRDRGRQFDVIILDPPKFAASKSQLTAALRGYKDINLLGMKLLRPGGYLVTFSCSGAVGAELFQQVLFEAAVDAGRWVQLVERLGQGADHPVLLTFPESQYLKGAVCRVE
jgi:23S rRNA (cytosine1962-C5)-methyltransferase